MISYRIEHGSPGEDGYHIEDITVDTENADFMTECLEFREAMAICGYADAVMWEPVTDEEHNEEDSEVTNDSTEDSD